jgi:hypothetical protein
VRCSKAPSIKVELDLDAGLASVTATRSFVGRYVSEVKLDGAGHVLVSHRSTSWAADELNHLAVLSPSHALLADIEVDTWATLKDGLAGRALFEVPGGMLVVNLDDAGRQQEVKDLKALLCAWLGVRCRRRETHRRTRCSRVEGRTAPR